MQKLLLLLLPLAIAACVDRDAAPAKSAGTPRVETYPSAPSAPSAAVASTGDPAQRITLPGRGEGERESPAPSVEPVAPTETAGDGMPDGSIDAPETSDVQRNRAGSSDAAPDDAAPDDAPRVPRFDPTNDPAIIDESGAPGFGGRVSSPESFGDGELRADDDDGTIEPDELPMLPADVVDAGPAMIP